MGRLNLTTPAEVIDSTLNEDLKAVAPTVIQRLIDMVESIFARYGKYDTGKAGYAEDMKLAANLAVDNYFLLSDPEFRKNHIQGVTRFKAGTYEQTNDKPKVVMSGEVARILTFYCVEVYPGSQIVISSKSSADPFTTFIPDLTDWGVLGAFTGGERGGCGTVRPTLFDGERMDGAMGRRYTGWW